MTSALAWLNDLMQWLARWFPRLVLIQPTHRGVLFGPRGGAHAVGPGLVCYWPITHALVEMPITTQSIQLCAQVLPVPGGSPDSLLPRVLMRAAAIQFHLDDPVAGATRALNLHALVDNRASAAIAKHHATDADGAAAFAELEQALHHYGVVLERLDFTQGGVGVAVKNLQDWSYSDAVDGKRPGTP